MNTGMPNLLLMLFFPLICIGLGAAMDGGLLLARRRRPSLFPGGANRLYWAVMLAAVLRSALFSLMFVPALALEGRVQEAGILDQFQTSIAMVLPALFGAWFATRLERYVFDVLESTLLRDRAAFLAVRGRSRGPEVG